MKKLKKMKLLQKKSEKAEKTSEPKKDESEPKPKESQADLIEGIEGNIQDIMTQEIAK